MATSINSNIHISLEKQICIYSYNSRGYNLDKQQFCRNLLNKKNDEIPILCNQENFVLKSNEHLIRKSLPGFDIKFKPAVKTNLEGRPMNGMFIAIPENYRSNVKDISPSNYRVQAITLDTETKKLMIINAYFPQDPKTADYHNDPELEEVYAVIKHTIATYQCDDVLLVGDLNIDFDRKNGHVKRLERFLISNALEDSWKKFNVDYTHEVEINQHTYTCTIDHIIWNENFAKNILNADVLHLPDNTSDHSPIYCSTNLTCLNVTSQAETQESHRFNLKNLNSDDFVDYAYILEKKLTEVHIPRCADCRNVHCIDTDHIAEIDNYAMDILEAMDLSIKSIVRKKEHIKAKCKIVAGWNDEVKSFRENAMFWHAIWISAGKPLNNTLHSIMKRTRNTYHYQIRKCKRSVEIMKKNKLLEACMNGNGDIFSELRKMRKVNCSVPGTMDGSKNVSKQFTQVYGELYNSGNDEVETAKILDNVNKCIKKSSLADVDLVTSDIVRQATDKIKMHKNDPVFVFNSDCLKCAPSSLFQHLSNLIRSFLIHGHVSKVLLLATLVPLLKDKLGDRESSDNYRSIALSSIILKIFDWVIIILFDTSFSVDELQFSYQKDCSTTMCTWLVLETVDYFLRNETEIFSCFLDMRKAFDMVKHSVLFKKLHDRNLSPIFTRLLLVMYLSQTANVRWDSKLSNPFSITNGVKQGAVLSAILFCVYIDDLIKQLRRNRHGCWMNGDFVGVVVYADDIVLLSPTLDGLQKMINTCYDYTAEHNLTFSTHDNPKKSKTKCMAFLKNKRNLRNLMLNDKKLPWVSSVKHLGVTITDELNNTSQDLLEKRAQYIAKNNELMQEFYYACPATKTKVNNIFNTHFYGAPLWDLFSPAFQNLEKSWNTSQRIMFALPRTTHRYLIEPLSGRPHIVRSIWKRFLKFTRNIAQSRKTVLRNAFKTVQHDCRSITGRNLRKIMLSTNHDVYNKADFEFDSKNIPYYKLPDCESWRIVLAKEILSAKSGALTVANFEKEELDIILGTVCCN